MMKNSSPYLISPYLNLISPYLIVALMLTYGCGKDSINSERTELCYSNENAQVLMHDDIDREYVLHIPSSYDGTSAVPLLMNFHGFGGSASEYLKYADMRSVAESGTFILAYPQGSCSDGFSHWNPCPLGGDNKSDADDFGFVEAMINEISSEYRIDADRVYAAGYSNGSMMAYGLANYKSELVAAVASVSGTMLDCIGPTDRPMPVVHLHGTNDWVIPYNGNSFYRSAQSVLDHWIRFNNTTTDPTVVTDFSGGLSIEHSVYDQGDRSVSVEHYKYIEGDHVWFDATFEGQNTAALIWNFVSRYDVNGVVVDGVNVD